MFSGLVALDTLRDREPEQANGADGQMSGIAAKGTMTSPIGMSLRMVHHDTARYFSLPPPACPDQVSGSTEGYWPNMANRHPADVEPRPGHEYMPTLGRQRIHSIGDDVQIPGP
jgi:hypothetical protein